jgi:hypothetical protein
MFRRDSEFERGMLSVLMLGKEGDESFHGLAPFSPH